MTFVPLPSLGNLGRHRMLWGDTCEPGLGYFTPASGACEWKKPKQVGDSCQALCKLGLCCQSPRCTRAQPSCRISHHSCHQRRTLYSWTMSTEVAVSLVGASVPSCCLVEVGPYDCLTCFALKSETKFGSARNEVIFKVNKPLTCKRFITLVF